MGADTELSVLSKSRALSSFSFVPFDCVQPGGINVRRTTTALYVLLALWGIPLLP